MQEASHIDLVIRSYHNPARVLIGADRSSANRAKWIWWTRLQPILSRLLAIALALLSCLVVLGEVTLFSSEPIGALPLLFRQSYGEVWTQVLCCLPLLYVSFCTYYSLFRLKVTGFYGLYQHNLTDSVHLLKSACMFCRLVTPLCLNFIHFIKVPGCQLVTVMGDINLVPILGMEFSTYFPSLLVLLCALNVGNCYSRFMEYLGIPQFKFSDNDDSLSTMEGEALIKKGTVYTALLDRDTASSGPHSPSYLRDSELADFQPQYSPQPKRTPTEIRKSLRRYYSPSP